MTALLSIPWWLWPIVVLGIIWAFIVAWLGVAMLLNAIGYLAAKSSY